MAVENVKIQIRFCLTYRKVQGAVAEYEFHATVLSNQNTTSL
jgi:hypothetical protein